MAKTQLISRKMLDSARNPPFVISALAQIDAGDFMQARKTLEDGLQGSKKRPIEGLLALASAYWDDPDQRARDPKRSIEYLKEAIQLAPKDARPYALLGRYLLSKGLRDQALNFLDRAIALDPDNAGVRRLRDRASLQKKKQYTVVKQAQDFTQQKPKRKGGGVGAAEGFKQSATRLLNLKDLGGAAEALEKAQEGEGKAIDNAIASLLKTDLVGANKDLLDVQNKSGVGGLILRTIFALLVLGAMGAVCGIAAQQLAPKAAVEENNTVAAKLRSDRVSELEKVIDASLNAEGSELVGSAAASHAILLAEHGGDDGHLEGAEGILGTASAEVRVEPEALLARSILATIPLAEPDPTLSRDLREALDDPKKESNPLVLMANAEYSISKNDHAKAKNLLTKAAFSSPLQPRAMHRLARLHAQDGETEIALDLLKKLWRDDKKHGASIATGVALLGTKEGAKERSELEKTLQKRVETELLVQDSAAPALSLLALSFAREDAKSAGAMKQLLTESDVLDRYPKLLARFSELLMTEIDDVRRAEKLLGEGLTKHPGEIALLTDSTRAQILRALPDDRIRQLRTSAERELLRDALVLPLGRWSTNFARAPLPYETTFDTRFFPEAEIQNALGIRGLNAQSAKRRLDVVAQLKLAEVSLGVGEIDAALAYVEQAEKEASSNPEVHLTRALIFAKQDKKEKARASIEEALTIEPDDPRILLAAAKLQRAAGDEKAARKALDRLVSEGFQSPEAHLIAARMALSEKDFSGAASQLQKAKKLSPDGLRVLLFAGELQAQQANFPAANALANKWIKHPQFIAAEQTTPVIQALTLIAKLTEDNANKTKSQVSELVAENPKEPVLRVLLAFAERMRKDEAAANDALNAALRRSEPESALQTYLAKELGVDTATPKKRKKRRKRRR